MKIALALSGGGVRASAFHCGVLERLALDGFLERTTFVSTVSGGSLVAGLIICRNSHRWPTSEQYLNSVLPQVAECLTTATLQWSYAWRSLALPWRLVQGRAHILAKQLEAQWGITGSLQRLPPEPRWVINATCYETGKNWRFSQPRMGDYLTNYVLEPDVPISDAIAASSSVPGLVGPLVVRSTRYKWNRYEGRKLVPASMCLKRYELWDGGVYDNLGVEPLFKSGGGFREGFELLLVSDASASLSVEHRTVKRMIRPGGRFLRLVKVASDQVRGLRSRAVVAQFLRNENSGAYFRIGNTVKQIYSAAERSVPEGDYLCAEAVERAATFPTTLRRLTRSEFAQLRRHGFEVADATLATRLPDYFAHRKIPR